MKKNSSSEPIYSAVVIGAGPSGVSSVANLLDCGLKHILWVDPKFNSGELPLYSKVPSNTKVNLFIKYCTSSTSLTHIINTYKDIPERDPISDMRTMEPDCCCPLAKAERMTSKLIHGIRDLFSDQIELETSWVTSVTKSPISDMWTITMGKEGKKVNAHSVIFNTGAHYRKLDGDDCLAKKYGKLEGGKKLPEEISLLDALDPEILQTKVGPKDVVAVIGTSHSGVLALKNLAELKDRPEMIKSFSRHDLLYALHFDGWILYDNTGLKGSAAEWAKLHLEAGKVEGLKRYDIRHGEAEVYSEQLPECTKIIYAIGFDRNRLPTIMIGDQVVEDCSVTYDPLNGSLLTKHNAHELNGLFGYGIGFPEKVTNKAGMVEFAVGMMKFMRYHKRVIPATVYSYIQKQCESKSRSGSMSD